MKNRIMGLAAITWDAAEALAHAECLENAGKRGSLEHSFRGEKIIFSSSSLNVFLTNMSATLKGSQKG